MHQIDWKNGPLHPCPHPQHDTDTDRLVCAADRWGLTTETFMLRITEQLYGRYLLHCATCGRQFRAKRSDAKRCGGKCRSDNSRNSNSNRSEDT